MSKQIITTSEAPAPIGPYSQAVRCGHLVFVSGQIAIDPATGNLVNESVEAETRQVMQNIKAILSEANLDFTHVIKTTIFLTDMAYFSTVNEIYGLYFHGLYPARETVAVKGLPKDVRVEISVIAGEK